MALQKIVDDVRNTTALDATKLTGTIAGARFPATLPVASGTNLTTLPAANLTGTLPAISGASLTNLPAGGKILQVVSNLINTTSTTTTTFPADTTIPQNTEGVELATLAITPTAANSTLHIYMQISGTKGHGAGIYMCLFVDTTADAIAVSGTHTNNYGLPTVSTSLHIIAAASTSARTYKMRIGCDSAAGNTAYINRTAGGNQGGNKTFSGLYIYEIGA